MNLMRGRYTRSDVPLKEPEITVTGELVEKIVDESLKYIEENWKKFAYVDNPDCAFVKIVNIRPIQELFEKLGHSPKIRNSVITELIEKLRARYNIVETRKSKVGGDKFTYAVVICRKL